MSLVGTDVGGRLLGGANLISLHLARLTGGDLLFGFLAAVLFATSLAVVSGLAISGAAAVSHDLYANVFRGGRATEASEVRVTKIATVGLGVAMIGLGILFRGAKPDIPDDAGLWDCRFGQFSGAGVVDVLAWIDDTRGALRRPERTCVSCKRRDLI